MDFGKVIVTKGVMETALSSVPFLELLIGSVIRYRNNDIPVKLTLPGMSEDVEYVAAYSYKDYELYIFTEKGDAVKTTICLPEEYRGWTEGGVR